DYAVCDCQFADRDLPLVGRGLQQHDACRRAAATHVILRDADAAAAAGAHLAPHALSRQVLVGGDRLDAYLAPVALEFLGDELRQPRMGALAHLRTRHPDDAAVVRLDQHPGIDLAAAVLRRRQRDAEW